MAPAATIRVARHVGAAFAATVVLLCCAGPSAASCGSYVHIVGSDGTQAPAKRDEKPCHGPFCHGAPKAPAPSPPASSTSGSETKAQPLANDALVPTCEELGFAHAPGATPVRRPSSIFHPPRLG